MNSEQYNIEKITPCIVDNRYIFPSRYRDGIISNIYFDFVNTKMCYVNNNHEQFVEVSLPPQYVHPIR